MTIKKKKSINYYNQTTITSFCSQINTNHTAGKAFKQFTPSELFEFETKIHNNILESLIFESVHHYQRKVFLGENDHGKLEHKYLKVVATGYTT